MRDARRIFRVSDLFSIHGLLDSQSAFPPSERATLGASRLTNLLISRLRDTRKIDQKNRGLFTLGCKITCDVRLPPPGYCTYTASMYLPANVFHMYCYVAAHTRVLIRSLFVFKNLRTTLRKDGRTKIFFYRRSSSNAHSRCAKLVIFSTVYC